MNTIEKQVTQTYLDNIAYFQQMHPRLYQQLAALETSIDKGYHMPKYELEYQEGYFDVVESSSGTLLYGSNSSDLAQRAAKSISYKKNENVLETFFARTFSDEALPTMPMRTLKPVLIMGLHPLWTMPTDTPHPTTLRCVPLTNLFF